MSMMDLSTVSSRIAVLQQWLGDHDVKTIVLKGESGIGKTWMAREISNWAVREGMFDLTLWVYLDGARGEPPAYDTNTLLESIVHQVSLSPNVDEWEVEDALEDSQEENNEKQMTTSGIREKNCILIVEVADGVEMIDNEFVSLIRTKKELNFKSSDKVLITTSKTAITDDPGCGLRVIELLSLTKLESLSLLQERFGNFDNLEIQRLAEELIEKTKRLPIGIILLAKSLSYFQENDTRVQVLKNALEEASENKSYNIVQLLSSGYSLLPSWVLVDLCWKGRHLFRDNGSIHCNELIAYWMLEGYLGKIDCIEKTYENGHSVLMELIDCHLLKSLAGGNICVDEGNHNLLIDFCGVKQEGTHSSFDKIHRLGYFDIATLGLATVSDSKWKGFGRISQTQGMISTICSPEKGQKLSTLLLDGNFYSNAFLEDMLKSSDELQVLLLSNWKLNFEKKESYHSLLEALSSKQNLSVLLIRDCNLLKKVDLTAKLHSLVVLQISNCPVKSMPNDLFKQMTYLQNLNLSNLLISSLPTSLYELHNLLWLVLSGCSYLTSLETLKRMTKLIVLDLSGAISLTTVVDTSFSINSQLKILNLSQTQISIPPFSRGLGALTHLILRGCEYISRLRGLDPLTSLQVLDLSGAKIFHTFRNSSLAKVVCLDVLDLSGTSIEQLPSACSDPLHLYLKSCSRLSKLSYIETLKRLEVLDVSGTSSLTEISETFFVNLGNLQNINFSGTSIKTLPSLSNLSELRQLLLSHCVKLEELPSLSSFKKLEVLDLSGCTSLEELDDESFQQMGQCQNLKELNLSGVPALRGFRAGFMKDMNHLIILNLSKTQLEGLPSLSNLCNLNQLLLAHCTLLKTLPDLANCTNLEVLDISGTAIEDLTSLVSCSKLLKLHLNYCSGLREYSNVLGVLKGASQELPYGISKLGNTKQLDLPDMKVDEGVDLGETSCSNEHQWRISSLKVEAVPNSWSCSASVSGVQFLHLFKETPTLLDTEFSKFHFSVHPTRCDELAYGGTCFRSSQFSRFREERLLEIHGFQRCPMGLEDILRHVDCLLLIDNKFGRWLIDLGASNLKNLKGCWFDRCSEMKSVFQPEEMEDDDLKSVDNLEVLGISNAVKLRTIFSQNPKQQIFQNLQCMYLDCCPELSIVFSSSFLPQSLRVLHIQFCDKIQTLFLDMSMPKLETLHLLELSILKSIEGTFPSLQSLSVSYCGNLETMFKSSTGTNCILTRLRTLQLHELPKLRILGATFPPLEQENVTGCPNWRVPEVVS